MNRIFNHIELINDLINLKEEYNDRVDNIFYSDMEHDLTLKDVEQLIELRNDIKAIYTLIEILDKEVR